MPTIEQSLRAFAQEREPVPYWMIEKDYALGYLLAGMAQIPALSEALILKGGTALRKFYFADYRFSEDLDFSAVMTLADVDQAMQVAVTATQASLLESGPFEVTLERLLLREPHPGGQDSFNVRIRFPSHREALCRLKVEISHDEEVWLDPELRPLLHAYPEPPHASWSCYALEEIVAEKLRALLQSHTRLQTRGWGASRVCRDYYDLWYVLTHSDLDFTSFPELLARKCALRGVEFTNADDFLSPDLRDVAKAEWEHQLLPFVPTSPPVNVILKDLAGILASLPLNI
ncbi:MAG: nucleotidyl transferase AbiEii/AbiGii toxin family protein [Anaerolineae bacterium]